MLLLEIFHPEDIVQHAAAVEDDYTDYGLEVQGREQAVRQEKRYAYVHDDHDPQERLRQAEIGLFEALRQLVRGDEDSDDGKQADQQSGSRS